MADLSDPVSKLDINSTPDQEQDRERSFYDGLSEEQLVLYEEPQLPPPPGVVKLLTEFVRTLARHTTDLYRLNCPAALVSGVSLLEHVRHWGDHPDLLRNISESVDPVERMRAVVKWVLSTLYGSFASRTPIEGSSFERKPYNPILGEQFYGWWPQHRQRVIVEQVSHHPPVSSFYLENEAGGIHVNGFSGQQTNFTGMWIRYRQPGRVFVYVERFDEEYCISLPDLLVKGLLPAGRPHVEITGSIDIVSTSKWAANIQFMQSSMMGRWFGGNSQNMLEGSIFHSPTNTVEYEIWGNWKQKIYCAPFDRAQKLLVSSANNDRSNANNNSVDVPPNNEGISELIPEIEEEYLFYDVQSNPIILPMVKPLEKQNDFESQRVWLFTTQALINKDHEKANEMKNAVEEQERGLRRERAARNETWYPRLFRLEEFCFMPLLDLGYENKEESEEEANNEEGVEENEVEGEELVEGDRIRRGSGTMNEEYSGRWIYKGFYDKFIRSRLNEE